MQDYLNHLTEPEAAPEDRGGFAPMDRRGTADMVVTGLLWCIPAALATLSLFIMAWFLMAAGACTAKKMTCAADPTVGLWIMTLGGIIAVVIGAAVSYSAARRGRPMFPGALLGNGLVLITWLAGVFFMTT